MKIIADKAIPFIQGRLPREVEILYLPSNEITRESVKDADALLIRTRTRCDASLLDGSKVKFIATATIGTDHIDLPWCEKAGITVKNAPGCNAPGVAQYVFASLLSNGFDPEKDTLGIIGNGNVGSVVARWAKSMKIRHLVSDAPKQESGDKTREYVPMDQLLRESEAVTLHVPLTFTGPFPTSNLISQKELSLMKPGAILVNSSRGGVVDEAGLLEAISRKGIKAIIDVWENEPEINSELARKAIVATPHIAGYSLQGKKRATLMVLEELRKATGIEPDLSGLECDMEKGLEISRNMILRSYNVSKDTEALRKNLAGFESLRNNYDYRNEPGFEA